MRVAADGRSNARAGASGSRRIYTPGRLRPVRGLGLVRLTVTRRAAHHDWKPSSARCRGRRVDAGVQAVAGTRTSPEEHTVSVASHDNPTTLVGRLAAVLGCFGVSLAAVACGGDDGSEAASTTTRADSRTTTSTRRSSTTSTSAATQPTATPTTSTSGTVGANAAEQEVIDRYVAYWDARTAANTGVPNPADPALAEFATGEQLQAVVAETQTNLDEGLAFRPAEQPADFQQVRVVSIDGDTAVVQDCRVDDEVVYRRDTGEVVNDAVATHNVRGELARVEGRWRLARAELVQRWEGVSGCAVGE